MLFLDFESGISKEGGGIGPTQNTLIRIPTPSLLRHREEKDIYKKGGENLLVDAIRIFVDSLGEEEEESIQIKLDNENLLYVIERDKFNNQTFLTGKDLKQKFSDLENDHSLLFLLNLKPPIYSKELSPNLNLPRSVDNDSSWFDGSYFGIEIKKDDSQEIHSRLIPLSREQTKKYEEIVRDPNKESSFKVHLENNISITGRKDVLLRQKLYRLITKSEPKIFEARRKQWQKFYTQSELLLGLLRNKKLLSKEALITAIESELTEDNTKYNLVEHEYTSHPTKDFTIPKENTVTLMELFEDPGIIDSLIENSNQTIEIAPGWDAELVIEADHHLPDLKTRIYLKLRNNDKTYKDTYICFNLPAIQNYRMATIGQVQAGIPLAVQEQLKAYKIEGVTFISNQKLYGVEP